MSGKACKTKRTSGISLKDWKSSLLTITSYFGQVVMLYNLVALFAIKATCLSGALGTSDIPSHAAALVNCTRIPQIRKDNDVTRLGIKRYAILNSAIKTYCSNFTNSVKDRPETQPVRLLGGGSTKIG